MALVWPQKLAVSPDIIKWSWNKTFFSSLCFCYWILAHVVLLKVGCFSAKKTKFKGTVRQWERSMDLRMMTGLEFRLDHRHFVIVLLQVPWEHWRTHRQFCSSKSRQGPLGYSVSCRPCGPKKTSGISSSSPAFFP